MKLCHVARCGKPAKNWIVIGSEAKPDLNRLDYCDDHLHAIVDLIVADALHAGEVAGAR